jgi:cobalamin biosynthesis protein CobC
MGAAASFDVFRLHGGKVEAARALFPHVSAPWIDLSTGISPWSYPHEAIPPEAFTRLPDPEAIAALEAAAAVSFGIADPACVIATPGSDLALRLLGRVFAGRRVAVVRPGYSGHVLAWGEADVTLISADDIEVAARVHDVVLLANPNNPDGRVVERERLLAAAEELGARGGTLIVDEAFADVRPEQSVCGALSGGVMVFRSFGKFFGLAGVRLGFVAMACPRMRRALRSALGDWPVSGLAVALGTAAYRDLVWQSTQRRRLQAAAECLDSMLIRAGLAIVGGTTLFRLARADAAAGRGTAASERTADATFRHLAQHGILTRPFSSDASLLRFGLPADEAQWQRLAIALVSRSSQ